MTMATLERPTKPASAPTTATTTRVHITHLRRTPTGQLWRVTDMATGETLIETSKDPEYDVCRVLLAKGVTGRLETFTGDRAHASIRMDIEKAAKLRTEETAKRGLRAVKWTSFTEIDD